MRLLLSHIPLKSLLQRLLGIYSLGFLLFTLVGPLAFPLSWAIFYTLLHCVFLVNNLRTAYGVYATHRAAAARTSREPLGSLINHMIIIPNYKESMETLTETLDILASHKNALAKYQACLQRLRR